MSTAPGMTAAERDYAQRFDARRKNAAAHWRTALRREFPEARFSVRVDGRDYITASWTGGPSEAQVMAVFRALREEHQGGIPRTLRTRTPEEAEAHKVKTQELANLRQAVEEAEHNTNAAIDDVLSAGQAGVDEAEHAARVEAMDRANEELDRLIAAAEELEAVLKAM
ncbi:LPD29 domain-containing protein [Citricoccus nitrophenolicus]|uniref:LPD29 domain-containing protein n=1 Tax=Citricoccus nitrophenolicus TaxID=863575 RepID=UPI0031E78503